MDPAHVPVILDTEAVAAARDAARAALKGREFDFDAALRSGVFRGAGLHKNSGCE